MTALRDVSCTIIVVLSQQFGAWMVQYRSDVRDHCFGIGTLHHDIVNNRTGGGRIDQTRSTVPNGRVSGLSKAAKQQTFPSVGDSFNRFQVCI